MVVKRAAGGPVHESTMCIGHGLKGGSAREGTKRWRRREPWGKWWERIE